MSQLVSCTARTRSPRLTWTWVAPRTDHSVCPCLPATQKPPAPTPEQETSPHLGVDGLQAGQEGLQYERDRDVLRQGLAMLVQVGVHIPLDGGAGQRSWCARQRRGSEPCVEHDRHIL